MYSNTGSRAGLVVFILTLIISLVSAVPIPIAIPGPQSSPSTTTTTLSSPNGDGQVLVQRDTGSISYTQHSQIPTVSTAIIARNVDEDNFRLERRSKVGDWFKNTAHKIGNWFKSTAHKVGGWFKSTAHKVGSWFKDKVGPWFKRTGAKIAKFALKAWSAVDEAAGKVIGYIVPGVGKLIGKGLDLAAKGINAVADKIHVPLSGKLQKVMDGFDKAKKYIGYVP